MDHNKPTEKDPHLDTPSVANEDKHINFLAEEEKASRRVVDIDIDQQEVERRKQEWQEGIDAGKREQNR